MPRVVSTPCLGLGSRHSFLGCRQGVQHSARFEPEPPVGIDAVHTGLCSSARGIVSALLNPFKASVMWGRERPASDGGIGLDTLVSRRPEERHLSISSRRWGWRIFMNVPFLR